MVVVLLYINQICVLSPQNTNKFRRKNMFNIYNFVLVSETSPVILNTRKFYDRYCSFESKMITITVVKLYCMTFLTIIMSKHISSNFIKRYQFSLISLTNV